MDECTDVYWRAVDGRASCNNIDIQEVAFTLVLNARRIALRDTKRSPVTHSGERFLYRTKTSRRKQSFQVIARYYRFDIRTISFRQIENEFGIFRLRRIAFDVATIPNRSFAS